MLTDARGTPVTGATPATLEQFETALWQYQSYFGDAIATIDAVLAETPEFVTGYLFKAQVLMGFAERQYAVMARAALEAVEPYLPRASDHERELYVATDLLVQGRFRAANRAFDRLLMRQPRDIMTAQTAHLMDFYTGDTLNQRNRMVRLLPHWDDKLPGYSYLLGMAAFGFEENNQYRDAEEMARRALDLEPRDPWAVHAGVHVMEMQGRVEEGIDWLESRQNDWAPDNGLAYHNWWHLALLYLDRGDTGRVLELFDTHIYPESTDMALQMLDVTALIWRLTLFGIDVGERATRIAADWANKLDGEGGFYAFNDLHALLSFAAAGRDDWIEASLEQQRSVSYADGRDNAVMTHEVGYPLSRGVAAFSRGDYATAIGELEAVRDGAFRFGGSHAQRDIITLTLIEAALRNGDPQRATHYLAERTVLRSNGELGWRLLERARRQRSERAAA